MRRSRCGTSGTRRSSMRGRIRRVGVSCVGLDSYKKDYLLPGSALGVALRSRRWPVPVPVKVMPPGVEHNMLKLLCMYLLYERKEETELSQAYQALVAERDRKSTRLNS